MNRQQWVIAFNTFRELVRSRVFLVLIVFAVLIFFMSLILGNLTFGDHYRVVLDFGLTAIQIVLVVLSVLLSISLVRKEIENKSVMSLLSKPLSRTDYFLGKFLGCLLLNVIFAFLGLVILYLILWEMNEADIKVWFQVYAGIIFESSVLLSLSLFLGMALQGVSSMAVCVGVFLLGHWLDSLFFFAQKSGNIVFINFAKIVSWLLPNLEMFNWRGYLYTGKIPEGLFFPAALHCMGWTIILLSLLNFMMKKKDII